MISDFHAKYFAYELTRRISSDNVEKLAATLVAAQVDLNPHQVEAALFAFKSPLSKGALLADEVGLGKTIEAGIVLSQFWAERRRKILLILPSSLRKQWHQELQEKFFLSAFILEKGSFDREHKAGSDNPFIRNEIVITSYQFAAKQAKYVRAVSWDLVVIDEAHRLRNVHKEGKIATAIKNAIEGSRKLLLTATPLQNSLLELYGLTSFIDEHAFGDKKSFIKQFTRLDEAGFADLRERLKPICKRTLRRQVTEYVNYTNRQAYTQKFNPSEEEQKLYDDITIYLQRESLLALPNSQRQLITLIMYKLLGSSSYAIAGALRSLNSKLEKKLQEYRAAAGQPVKIEPDTFDDTLRDDLDHFDDISEEFETEDGETFTNADIKEVAREAAELKALYERAENILENEKGRTLIKALDAGFSMTRANGGKEKAIIFTESRRTQEYVQRTLEANGYAGQIVLFNGTNNSPDVTKIYQAWFAKHKGTDKVTGAKTADTRAALVEYFRDSAKIMIATEAAAEGINLQFCSLVINYDLPWNPQRIEQRIGRCHRYGQKCDVVVVNFLNTKNKAEERIYQLLSEKFKLFSGIFGASDEVLGTIGSGIDFEKRILEIYRNCRTTEEIESAFNRLQAEMESEIDEKMHETRTKLLENFDEEVHQKLKDCKKNSSAALGRYQKMLFDITKHELKDIAFFDEKSCSFNLGKNPFPGADIPTGLYQISRDVENAHVYGLHHPLARKLIEKLQGTELQTGAVTFTYTGKPKISILEKYIGKSGYLTAHLFTVESFEAEDHIIIAAITDDGNTLDEEESQKLFLLEGEEIPSTADYATFSLSREKDRMRVIFESRKNGILKSVEERNSRFFDEELDKLEKWAEDMKASLEIALKELDVEIKTKKTEARKIQELQAKVEAQREIKRLEAKRNEMRQKLYDSQDEIDRNKEELIGKTEARLRRRMIGKELFAIYWRLE